MKMHTINAPGRDKGTVERLEQRRPGKRDSIKEVGFLRA